MLEMRFPAALGIGDSIRENPSGIASLIKTAVIQSLRQLLGPMMELDLLMVAEVKLELPIPKTGGNGKKKKPN